MNRRTRVRLLSLVANLAVTAGAIGLVVYSDLPIVRYNNCFYDLVYGREGAAGVVVVGSSRVGRGIEADIVGEHMTAAGLTNPISVVLFRPGNGIDDYPQIVRDVTSELGVDEVFLMELSIPDPPGYQSIGRNAAKVTSSEILAQLRASNEPIDGRLRDLAHRFSTKLDLTMNSLISGDTPAAPAPIELTRTDQSRAYCRWTQKEIRRRPGQLRNQRDRIESSVGEWTAQDNLSWNIEGLVDYERFDFLVRSTIDEAELAGVPLMFFKMPAYLDPPVSADFTHWFEGTYEVPLLTPPTRVLAKLYDNERYRDINHVGEKGRRVLTNWLAAAVADELTSGRG